MEDKRQNDNKVSVTKVKKMTEKLHAKSAKDFDVEKSRSVELKELLKYDHLMETFFLEDNGLKKHKNKK